MEAQMSSLSQDNTVLRGQLHNQRQTGGQGDNLVDMLMVPDRTGEDALQRMTALSKPVASLNPRGLTEPI